MRMLAKELDRMPVDVVSVVASVVAGSISGLSAASFAAAVLKDRWMARVNATYASQLEAAKAEYATELEGMKDTLARGSYVTKAQFDVELNAYKELWSALSDVRNTARSFLAQEKFVMAVRHEEEPKYRIETFSKSMMAFHAAHNAAVVTTERYAPFYPQNIKQAARRVTEADIGIVNFYAAVGPEMFSKLWFNELESKIVSLCTLVDRVEDLIRDRMTAVRILQ